MVAWENRWTNKVSNSRFAKCPAQQAAAILKQKRFKMNTLYWHWFCYKEQQIMRLSPKLKMLGPLCDQTDKRLIFFESTTKTKRNMHCQPTATEITWTGYSTKTSLHPTRCIPWTFEHLWGFYCVREAGRRGNKITDWKWWLLYKYSMKAYYNKCISQCVLRNVLKECTRYSNTIFDTNNEKPVTVVLWQFCSPKWKIDHTNQGCQKVLK